MQISRGIGGSLVDAAEHARQAQQGGFDSIAASETAHDPFLPLALAAQATDSLTLQTRIAVAFARSPMITATLARDLQVLSNGRLELGLGTQTRAHIRRRFDMPWSERPAVQMREYVAALRAIWSDWDGGEPLAFKGEHYRLTLMTDTFRPEPAELPHPPVHVAAVGRHMTRLAGEVGDGLIPHSFSTADWFREVTLPAVREGLERAGRDRSTFVVHCPGMVVVTAEEGPTDAQLRQVRAQIAFYGSTPAYADVLRFHGWSALYEALHQLSVTDDPQRWERMTELVDDEVLAAFGVIGPLREVCKELASRYGTDVDVVHLHPPQGTGAEELKLARALLEGE